MYKVSVAMPIAHLKDGMKRVGVELTTTTKTTTTG
jgi:hypothetical protein